MTELRHHEIAEAEHRILNPFTDAKLMELGAVCRIGRGTHILDLACGKGEMLCRWSSEYGAIGHGVDLSETFIAAARARAKELEVDGKVSFEQADASTYSAASSAYDVVACVGATWIGGGLAGTIDLMRPALAPGGLLLIGEPYWTERPPDGAYGALGLGRDDYTDLPGTLDRFAASGTELVEMVLADQDSWDRYMASQWWTIHDWLKAHPDHADAGAMRAFADSGRRSHLTYGRRYLGWGVFALRTDPA